MKFVKITKDHGHYVYNIAGIKIKLNQRRNIKGYILKQKRELNYKIKRFIDKFSKCKKYDLIITLGMNCNFSEAFLKYFRFYDSTFWNWVAAYNCAKVQIEVTKDLNVLFKDGFSYKNHMWYSNSTGLGFHGRSVHSQLLQPDGKLDAKKLDEDLEELISRTKYLYQKNKKYMSSDKKKLFVYTVVAQNRDEVESCAENAQIWYEYLKNNTNNFDFLVICARQYYKTIKTILTEQYPEIYVRKVKSNYEHGQVLHLDIMGWCNIFKEFRPSKIQKSKNKTLKYDKL